KLFYSIIISLYEFKLGHSAALATRNINTAFGEGSANERRTRRWFEKFRSGDTNLDNLPRGHAPFVIDDTILKDMIEVDPTLTVREVAERLNVHHSTVVRHLRRLGKVKKLDKWVPHELTEREPHVAKKTIKKLSELNIEVLPHPPYSPDISPTDYHLFKHLDGFLTGKVFQEEKRVKDAFHEFIGSRSSDFFKHGIDTLVSRWNKCIEIDGDYFD
ncbi:Histone-lysine N-methyltransferase SETMAR, partial [Ooceraea biroi]